ncbi:metal-dependent hydrolase [Halococcoides cellulosivorans]|uniref:Metal-dependent hydrolase n=1 Tax=Halococcoides cellulosivorans TaxID=1679096 RepID=A0A2R4X0S6_9EURY|nr:metal-dependent hydrolase [Halococcoides cellulosivorans]AWB27404.1 hypothetical protein HARCEL1_06660 [Halococcoides cellulosivorans]
MSSLLVHMALAGLFTAALLGEEFDGRALGVAVLAVALVDMDVFLSPVIQSAHRAAGHTLVWPALFAVGVLVVSRIGVPEPAREDIGRSMFERLRERWASFVRRVVAARTPRRLRLGWLVVAVVVFAGIGPDLFSNGVNLFWPIHDQFYTLNGEIELSTTRGIVQTVVDLSPDPTQPASTTQNTFYSTGVDPTPGAEPANVERTFPIAWSGLEILLMIASATIVSVRLALARRRR